MSNLSNSDATYNCDKCEYSTYDLSHLKGHNEFVHEKVGDLDDEDLSLDDEVNETDEKAQEGFPCGKCSYVARIRANLRRHVDAVHEGVKKFACPNCEQKFSSKEHYVEHNKRVHDKIEREKKLACEDCDYKTPYSWVLRKHLRGKHGKVMYLKCKKCEYTTTANAELQSHQMTVHMNTKEKCHKCSYETKYASRLKEHVREVHDKIKDEACPLCSFKTKRKSAVQKHLRTVHKKTAHEDAPPDSDGEVHEKIRNDPQDKMSKVPEIAKHFSITPEGLYLCRACSFTTKKSGDLNKHIKKIHLKAKDKSCDQCGFKTRSSGSLRSHIQKFHQRKSSIPRHLLTVHKKTIYEDAPSVVDGVYGCRKCTYSTNEIIHLKIHVESVHEKDESKCSSKSQDNVIEEKDLNEGFKGDESEESQQALCSRCPYVAEDQGQLKLHVLNNHVVNISLRSPLNLSMNLFECPQCELKFKEQEYLDRHMQDYHEMGEGSLRESKFDTPDKD